ncbi:hypothetical protein AB1Y20_018511 [Prymnesium parvum]|uniref:Phosphoribosyltransferase domain-containing protein n=1 Tax=Prymnesium parvum TaxID=97485 RepID=A0AB34JNW0_PRYPA
MSKPSHTILYAPGMEEMALGIAALVEGATALCTTELINSAAPPFCAALCWEKFPSGDPNLKLRMSAVRDKHVILLMNHDTMYLFEQLAVLLHLQRFNVPKSRADLAARKWKQLTADDYETCSAKSVTVITPWYRHCQMERTCRWTVRDDRKWDNSDPNGEFVDVPTAQSFAAMLSSLPIPGTRPLPPQQLLLIDIHEYEDLEKTLISTGRWSNQVRPYDYTHGTGTFFTSAFARYLSSVLYPSITDVASQYVVFPDSGAHRRFISMVENSIKLPLDHILWISKTRVGASITQKDDLFFRNDKGEECKLQGRIPDKSTVLIADDFTNSGSTIFGGAEIVRSHAGADVTVNAFVSHFVAKYDHATVKKFVDKLYQDGCGVDSFTCTDSIPNVVQWLQAAGLERQAAGLPQKAFVMPLAPLIADWILQEPLGGEPRRFSREECLTLVRFGGCATLVRRTSAAVCAKEPSSDLKAAAAAGALAGALVGAAAAVCVLAFSARLQR